MHVCVYLMREACLWIRTPQHHNSFRLPPRHIEIPGADGFEERPAFLLEPVGLVPGPPLRPLQPQLHRDIEQVGPGRPDAAGRPFVERDQDRFRKGPAAPLIGYGRVRESVADNDFAPLEGWPNGPRDVLRARGQKQEQLGPGSQRLLPLSQDQVSDPFRKGRASRFPC